MLLGLKVLDHSSVISSHRMPVSMATSTRSFQMSWRDAARDAGAAPAAEGELGCGPCLDRGGVGCGWRLKRRGRGKFTLKSGAWGNAASCGSA
ncbi:hypothetical protein EIW28_12610 [Glycomyces terrestris]|uniref:Uncharacterized protein n=1 Tax=Glycomyces terrestris TaxID=2493553 RepID=A0A426UY94_9ACTN|nr:hypothetical protein EIW28_12610 [Glycomyces terrestris]